MREQGSRRLWLMEGNPELPVALEVSLLCLQVATSPDSSDALEMYSCARRNYAVPLLNPSSCLSLACDRFSVDLSPGSGLCVIWRASDTFLHQLRAYHPAHQLPFQSCRTHWSWRGWLQRDIPEPMACLYTSQRRRCLWNTWWIPPALLLVFSPWSLVLFLLSIFSSYVLCPLVASCPCLTCQFF